MFEAPVLKVSDRKSACGRCSEIEITRDVEVIGMSGVLPVL